MLSNSWQHWRKELEYDVWCTTFIFKMVLDFLLWRYFLFLVSNKSRLYAYEFLMKAFKRHMLNKCLEEKSWWKMNCFPYPSTFTKLIVYYAHTFFELEIKRSFGSHADSFFYKATFLISTHIRGSLSPCFMVEKLLMSQIFPWW